MTGTIDILCPCSFKTNVTVKIPSQNGKSMAAFFCATCKSRLVVTMRRVQEGPGAWSKHGGAGQLQISVTVKVPSQLLLDVLREDQQEREKETEHAIQP